MPDGEKTSFPLSVKTTDDEVVYFSWIKYESREHRDAVNAKVHADERLGDSMEESRAVFDASRMIWGGFAVDVEL